MAALPMGEWGDHSLMFVSDYIFYIGNPEVVVWSHRFLFVFCCSNGGGVEWLFRHDRILPCLHWGYRRVRLVGAVRCGTGYGGRRRAG